MFSKAVEQYSQLLPGGSVANNKSKKQPVDKRKEFKKNMHKHGKDEISDFIKWNAKIHKNQEIIR